MPDETSAHHHGGEVADGQRIGGRVGAPVEFFGSASVEIGGVFDSGFGLKAAINKFFR